MTRGRAAWGSAWAALTRWWTPPNLLARSVVFEAVIHVSSEGHVQLFTTKLPPGTSPETIVKYMGAMMDVTVGWGRSHGVKVHGEIKG